MFFFLLVGIALSLHIEGPSSTTFRSTTKSEEELTEINEWAIKFTNSTLAATFAMKYDLSLVTPFLLEPSRNTFLFALSLKRSMENTLFIQMLKTGGESEGIVWWEKQKLRRFSKRIINTSPNQSYKSSHLKRNKDGLPFQDPLLPTQWHLHNLTEPSSHVHVNVLPIWRRGILGHGVTIAFVDDGVQYNHPDLSPNWKKEGNWNYNLRSSDILPSSKDYHGTAVAGLAVASPDGEYCGVGVAPRAHFTAVVLLQDDLRHTDAMAAQALSHQYGVVSIYSNSWGPEDDGMRKERPGPLTEQAIQLAIEKGREGLGSIYVWAAGNGKQNKDNCNYDGYANNRLVATFGAVDSNAISTHYSEPCSALIGVLPSGDGSDTMQTTDLMGTGGQNTAQGTFGDCNTNFAGTSAAAPLAAGIAALMLSSNPAISWLDFQYILVLSAIRNDPQHSSWKQNGAGYWVSHCYGFGIIDANRSVTLAEAWKSSVKEVSQVYSKKEQIKFQTRKKESTECFIKSSIRVTDVMTLHHVEIIVDIKHKCRGHLEIKLTSPYETESILAEEHYDCNADYDMWKFTTLMIWGEGSIGEWSLLIVDKGATPDPNSVLNEWTLKLYGTNNRTQYETIFSASEEQHVWDLRAAPLTKSPAENSYGWLKSATDSVWKIVLMGTMICGIIFLVVSVIVVFIVKREKSRSLLLDKDDPSKIQHPHYTEQEEEQEEDEEDSTTSIEFL